MIVWTLIWVVLIAGIVWSLRDIHNRVGVNFTCVALIILVLIGSAIAVGINQSDSISAASDWVLVDEATRVRDGLAETVRDELSADQYEALLSALPDDTDLIWLGDGASAVLIERATRIISLNERIYELETGIISKRKSVCDSVANPILPRFPFGLGLPDCDLDLERDQ